MGGFGLAIAVKDSSSQCPETDSTAFGRMPISRVICTNESASGANSLRLSSIQGQGPPPWEMKYVGSRSMRSADPQ